MDVASLTVEEFLARLGSSDPTPGGGSLAAVAGAMAAAMLAMVCNLTIGRPRYADVDTEVRAILSEANDRQRRLILLANADAEAYLAVRDAYRLPRSGGGESAGRAAAIERTMRRATEVPLETAESARAVLDLAMRSAETTSVAALADVAVAAHLALAAARSAADQARLNLTSLADPQFASTARERINGALAGAEEVVAKTLHTVDTRAGAR